MNQYLLAKELIHRIYILHRLSNGFPERNRFQLPAPDSGNFLRPGDMFHQVVQPFRMMHNGVRMHGNHIRSIHLPQSQIQCGGMHQRRRHSMNLGFGTFNKPDPGEGTQISKGFITGGIVITRILPQSVYLRRERRHSFVSSGVL